MTSSQALQWLNLGAFTALLITVGAYHRRALIRPWSVALLIWAANNAVFYAVVLAFEGWPSTTVLNLWSSVTKLQAVFTALSMVLIAARGGEWTRR